MVEGAVRVAGRGRNKRTESRNKRTESRNEIGQSHLPKNRKLRLAKDGK